MMRGTGLIAPGFTNAPFEADPRLTDELDVSGLLSWEDALPPTISDSHLRFLDALYVMKNLKKLNLSSDLQLSAAYPPWTHQDSSFGQWLE